MIYALLAGVSRERSAARAYASTLNHLRHFEEAKSLLRRSVPVARRVLGEGSETTLRMRSNYAAALFNARSATLDDVREAVATLAETERNARRTLGGEHPLTTGIEEALGGFRAALRARDTPSTRG